MVLFCVGDELVPSKHTRGRGKCLCTCVCSYIFVTQEGQERLGERPLFIVLLRQKKDGKTIVF